MTDAIDRSVSRAVFHRIVMMFLSIFLAIWVIDGLLARPAWALTPKQQYYRAENAYAALQKNPRHQKYRDKWLSCIDKFEKVARLDPSGGWAAAGLYQSGRLYLELHRRSYLDDDREKAAEAFQQVIQRYPNSRYASRSRSQLGKLGKSAVPASKRTPNKQLKRAHAAFAELLGNAAKQKYRDQWERCIAGFQTAYRVDTNGPDAAEALYMTGMAYKGLSVRSRRQADHDRAMEL
ncbi:MAG: tetratricopeptide repeat protein, partial [Desulfosarcina sp.]